ncbi:MAG: hypothetical protein K2G24_05265 [Muribaculaceae bacterium]|nr:hypothetical protein [Muribaculaceae bacterium]
MKPNSKHWIWILLGTVALVAAVIIYMVFPLHQNDINEKAVAAQAASYYDAVVGQETDSVNAQEAQRIVEGD